MVIVDVFFRLLLKTEDQDLSEQSLGEQVLNTKELATKLRCSRPMLYRLMSSGGLPKGFSLGRNRRWLTSEIDCWLREKAQRAQKAR